MKRIFCVLVSVFFVTACFSFSGCSKLQQPPAQEINNSIDRSLADVVRLLAPFSETSIDKEDGYNIKHEVYPSMKRDIDGTQYNIWPIKVTGTAIFNYKFNLGGVVKGKLKKYVLDANYTLYCYKNSVGEYREFVEENNSTCRLAQGD